MADFFGAAGRFTELRFLIWLGCIAVAIYWAITDPTWLPILVTVASPVWGILPGYLVAWVVTKLLYTEQE